MKKRFAIVAVILMLLFVFVSVGSQTISADINEVDFETPRLPYIIGYK